MSMLNWRTLTAAAIAGAALFTVTAGAQARDRDRDDDRWDRKHHRHYDHHRHGDNDWRRHERPVVVRERPVYVMPQQPMYQQTYQQPMYQQPYQQQGDQGINLNFTIPLR